MSSDAKADQRSLKHTFYGVIGSAGFKWVLGVLGGIALGLLALGADAWARSQVIAAPEFIATKADVISLKAAVKDVSDTAALHTFELADLKSSVDDTKQVQKDIYNSLKSLSGEIHALDTHLGKVEQKVDDDNLRSTNK